MSDVTGDDPGNVVRLFEGHLSNRRQKISELLQEGTAEAIEEIGERLFGLSDSMKFALDHIHSGNFDERDRRFLREVSQFRNGLLDALAENGTLAARRVMLEVARLYEDEIDALNHVLDLHDLFTTAALGSGEPAPVREAQVTVRELAKLSVYPENLKAKLPQIIDDRTAIRFYREVIRRCDQAGLLEGIKLAPLFEKALKAARINKSFERDYAKSFPEAVKAELY